MKQEVRRLIAQAVRSLQDSGRLPAGAVGVEVDRTRAREHGDFATNVALTLSKPARLKPRDLAQALVERLPSSPHIARVEIAGPGFINFHLAPMALHDAVRALLALGDACGMAKGRRPGRIHLEFVSANPNGPLHVGHGRGAAYGDSLARLLRAAGHDVHREYYINDAGRQMDILAVSVWLRYLELSGEDIAFPRNGYRGDYVYDIAAALRNAAGSRLHRPAHKVFAELPPDEREDGSGDKEEHIDALIARAVTLLGEKDYRDVHKAGLNAMLDDIRADLREFGVEYDQWFSEKDLMDSGAVERALTVLADRGHLYDQDGALWFRSTDFGDDKDRVVRRENGVYTYFASDIAYHLNKFERGFTQAIDIWGADHHGYVPRVQAALAALGLAPDAPGRLLDVLLVQFAVLWRGGEKVQMSTRSGEFVTLRELRREVGNDAARFFYVLRKSEAHMDFDLDLAKSQSNDNPVYYIQYAHARILSVFRQLRERGLGHEEDPARVDLGLLTEPQELDLMNRLARFDEVIEEAAAAHAPHQLAYYLRELANDLHVYYNAHSFLKEEAPLRDARLTLIRATRQVLAGGLAILGVSAPESM